MTLLNNNVRVIIYVQKHVYRETLLKRKPLTKYNDYSFMYRATTLNDYVRVFQEIQNKNKCSATWGIFFFSSWILTK